MFGLERTSHREDQDGLGDLPGPPWAGWRLSLPQVWIGNKVMGLVGLLVVCSKRWAMVLMYLSPDLNDIRDSEASGATPGLT